MEDFLKNIAVIQIMQKQGKSEQHELLKCQQRLHRVQESNP